MRRSRFTATHTPSGTSTSDTSSFTSNDRPNATAYHRQRSLTAAYTAMPSRGGR